VAARKFYELITARKLRKGLRERLRKRRQRRKARRLATNPFKNTDALKVFLVPDSRKRISIVTDSIGKTSFFGGVATATIMGALLANRLNADLRIVTRQERSDGERLLKLYKSAGIELQKNLSIEFSPSDDPRGLPICENELFITTSWWTTRSALHSISKKQLIYILQEDERMFYESGDASVRCQEVFNEEGFPVVINAKLLFEHLTTGPAAVEHFKKDGMFFEPAFSYQRKVQAKPRDGKRRFFFYARPMNPRNLFWRGVEVINRAIDDGLLDLQKWEIYFVGSNIFESFRLNGNVAPIVCSNMSWDEYSDLIKSMDAGLCLMASPHPSYPPLDLAAVGVPVLTNCYLNKTNLSNYSSNIMTREVDVESLASGMGDLLKLALDHDARVANCSADNIQRDWAIAFEPVISRLSTSFGS